MVRFFISSGTSFRQAPVRASSRGEREPVVNIKFINGDLYEVPGDRIVQNLAPLITFKGEQETGRYIANQVAGYWTKGNGEDVEPRIGF